MFANAGPVTITTRKLNLSLSFSVLQSTTIDFTDVQLLAVLRALAAARMRIPTISAG